MAWTWRYETREGGPVADSELPTDGFSSQSDAETWIGEAWPELASRGVDQVSLLEDGRVVYGPMSLHLGS